MTARILIVDDEAYVRVVLQKMLVRHGYACTLAADASGARKCLEAEGFDLVLCDVNMPGESGIDLVRHIREAYQDTAVIMVTGIDEGRVADRAIAAGIYGYILKPLSLTEILINVRNGLRRRDLEIANRRYSQELERMVEERTAGLRRAMEDTIRAMGLIVESRDPYTAGHQRRVARLSAAMAEAMGLSKGRIQGLSMAAEVHDLGKITIPVGILVKPTQLSALEFSLIRTHPQAGHDILKDIAFPWPIADIVLQHHERMDGSGYPQGLRTEDILLEARILGVADVVEAMASCRPYRPTLGIESALGEIATNAGRLYDRECVEACLRVFERKAFSLQGEDPGRDVAWGRERAVSEGDGGLGRAPEARPLGEGEQVQAKKGEGE